MKRNLDYIVRKLYGDNKDIVPSMEIRRSSFSMLYYITLNKNNIVKCTLLCGLIYRPCRVVAVRVNITLFYK